MTERMIEADGVELATEAFGDPARPPVLLIMGNMASMLWWPDAFCERLAKRGRYVIRYDNRDTGLSKTYAPGSPAYTGDDMVDDAVRVLDGYGVATAHFVGISMGAMIAQMAALKHPARAATLTVISATPYGEVDLDLPRSTPAYREYAARVTEPDWTDRDQVVRFFVEDGRQVTGSGHAFDEASLTRLVERDFDRARNFASVTNHNLLADGDGWHGRLSELRAPLLVIHGTDDPLFPIEHGVAVARAVAGASLVRLEGTGHELHEADWDEIIAAIVAHSG